MTVSETVPQRSIKDVSHFPQIVESQICLRDENFGDYRFSELNLQSQISLSRSGG